MTYPTNPTQPFRNVLAVTTDRPRGRQRRLCQGNHGDAENVKRALDALTDASSILERNFTHGERVQPGGMDFFHGIFQRKISAL